MHTVSNHLPFSASHLVATHKGGERTTEKKEEEEARWLAVTPSLAPPLTYTLLLLLLPPCSLFSLLRIGMRLLGSVLTRPLPAQAATAVASGPTFSGKAPWRRYLIEFVDSHRDFRLAELKAVADILEVDWVLHDDQYDSEVCICRLCMSVCGRVRVHVCLWCVCMWCVCMWCVCMWCVCVCVWVLRFPFAFAPSPPLLLTLSPSLSRFLSLLTLGLNSLLFVLHQTRPGMLLLTLQGLRV